MTRPRRKNCSRPSRGSAVLWAAALSTTLFLGWLGGCDALVGGECLPGYVVQDNHCVPVDGIGGGGAGQGGGGGTSGGGSFPGGGGTFPGGGGTGTGGTGASSSGTGNNGQGGTGGNDCVPPLVWCPPCVDLQIDFKHCGACGNYCPTELCVAGKCSGDPIGHLAVLGMSYVTYHQPMQRLLGNAAFLPPNDPVRILEYAKHAYPKANDNVAAIIKAEALLRNRTFGIVEVTIAGAVGKWLDSEAYQVLLIHDQALAPAGQLGAFGATINNSVHKFLLAGNTVVVLGSNEGTNEMPAFLVNAGLMQVQGFTPITGQSVLNAVPNDILGNVVQWPFLAKEVTSTISTMELPSAFVTYVFTDTAQTPAPVGVHKTFKN